jgi:Dolichyl-phosphate-mannose-protein mannosyltransferase
LTGLVERLQSVAPLAAVLIVGCILVAAEPVTAPWWINADADGTYAASALNIISGDRSRYFDHPGLVNQELLAVTFGFQALPSGGASRIWATNEITHLNRARWVYRGWAIALFLGGALLAYSLMRRLFGHWSWGVAGGLLWLAQPTLTDAIQIRPDVLLAALMLLAGYFIVTGFERRSVARYAVAAGLTGVALMDKVHAVALIPALLLATAFAYPGSDWSTKLTDDGKHFLIRRWLAVGLATALWVVLFFVLNGHHDSFSTAGADGALLGLTLFALFDYALATWVVHHFVRWHVARRIFDPFYLMLIGALAVGVALPLLLMMTNSLWILSLSLQTLLGGNINSGVKPFADVLPIVTSFPVLEAMIVIVVAGVAAVVGVARRTAWPLIWFAAAATATLLAMARSGELRYYAPGYVLAIPAAFWLLRRRGSVVAPVLVWVLVLVVLVPSFVHMRDDAHKAHAAETQSAAANQLADKLLGPNQFAVVSGYYYPVADARWWSLVANYIYSAPDYPYRFVPDVPAAIQAATSEGEHASYYIGPLALGISHRQTLTLGSGTYEVSPIASGQSFAKLDLGAVKLLSGPGT